MNPKTTQKSPLDQMLSRPIPKRWVGIIRLQMVKEGTLYGTHRFQNPREAVEMVRPLFQKSDRELMLVMSLSASMEPLAVEIAAVGGVNACCVDVRNVFKHALLSNASYVVCFHNHPSGSSDPSREDQKITTKMCEAGRVMGIPLIDHIIVGDDFYSFREHGEIEGADDLAA